MELQRRIEETEASIRKMESKKKKKKKNSRSKKRGKGNDELELPGIVTGFQNVVTDVVRTGDLQGLLGGVRDLVDDDQSDTEFDAASLYESTINGGSFDSEWYTDYGTEYEQDSASMYSSGDDDIFNDIAGAASEVVTAGKVAASAGTIALGEFLNAFNDTPKSSNRNRRNRRAKR